jgi:uncharacterized protein (TIGR02147 family)
MADIFSSLDYREFLKAAFEERRAKNPAFSLRMVSSKAGIPSTGYLSLVLAGKRNLASDVALDIAKLLSLTKRESEYLLLLIRYSRAKRSSEKQRIFDDLLRFKRGPVRLLTESQYEFYSAWYITVVRELVAVYRVTDENFYSLLQPSIKPAQARRALTILCRLGLLGKSGAGYYERLDATVAAPGALRQLAVRKFQADAMELAKSALERFEPDERDISTVTMSIDDATFEKVKSRLEELRADIASMAQRVSEPNRVYHLNLQLIPVCKKREGGRR